ncbi:restriction endonuclease subunit S [Pediococcus ethanolidurans]|uniref:Restriction endonuclease S subunit n=1 Tax=Pediococcus ethanolidurans TaxID=319653 RepID=A0A0R2K8R6_9LACO|nr:restriction endonuclease subunit S [Pediococcus ethanolidurans]KRN83612.1 hypothetical protein IV87_GL000081 [Pediococcus ethanolidurans]GEN94033.1 type I restriction enzyme specificity protein [Pediococcus ethanolidurans]SER02637.1 Restriction endonuclease S subunit [Pediococcus ethanolidurans]
MSEKIQPKVRFSGFTDAWEQRKLSDIVSRLSKSSNNSELPRVEFEDIVSGEGRLNKDVSHKFDDRKGILFSSQNILYGKLRPYLKNWLLADFKGIALGDFWVFKSINSDPKFVYSLIQSNHYQKVANDTSGTKMPRSDWKKVSSTEFQIPSSLEEQKKIGSLFKQLDNTIALHQRKLAKLKELKQGYLQKLFPQNGSKFPQLRFAGFADAWEQCKLGKLGSFIRNSIFPQKFSNDEFVEYSMPAFDDRKRPKAVSGIMMQSGRLKISGEVLLINKLNVRQRRIWLVENANHNAVASGEFMPFISDKVVLSFLEQLLLSDRTTRDLESISSGTSNSQKRVTPSDLLGYKIQISSSKTEQTQIATLLKDLDSLIAANQQKYNQLKKVKKWCMQNLFV